MRRTRIAEISDFEFRIANWWPFRSAIRNPQSAIGGIAMICCVLMLGVPWGWANTVNRIVAVVNDDVVTEADVLAQMRALEEERDPQSASTDGAQSAEMRQMVLNHLIEQRLILQEAKRAGILVTSDEVVGRLEAVRGRFG